MTLGMQRLLELYTWASFDQSELGHKTFDFSCFENYCGTAGCLAGELPFLYPDRWVFNESKEPTLIGRSYTDASLEIWFDLQIDEINHLFYPTCQKTKLFGGKRLGFESEKLQVLSNLRSFIKRKLEQPE
jgi:hypothetical protein